MGTTEKWFEDKSGAFNQLYQDVGNNNIKVYTVEDYKSKVSIPVHPPAVLDKFTHLEIATSGNVPSGPTWLSISSFRVDESSGKKVYDNDPILTIVDSNTGSSHASGVINFHQDFDERTSNITGYETFTIEQTVSDLRNDIVSHAIPLESGSPTTLNALSHMYQKHKLAFGDNS